MSVLDFKKANCKNCYKCLRECPVKSISVLDHQARVREDRCILCGMCTRICPQNAKVVKDDKAKFLSLLASGKKVCVSVAPSFISNFDVNSFAEIDDAFDKLGVFFTEETAVGAKLVTEKYKKILVSSKPKNLITSACPSTVRLIQQYYPSSLQYLAMVDSPMTAHAKMLKARFGNDIAVVFIGPCISKKREAEECGVIDCVLTFEEINCIFNDKQIKFTPNNEAVLSDEDLRAKYYPINRGIIKSFYGFVDGYEYISVDGVKKCKEVLENISSLSGMFIEMSACEFSCVNGPCKIDKEGSFIKATETVRRYANPSKKKPLKPTTALSGECALDENPCKDSAAQKAEGAKSVNILKGDESLNSISPDIFCQYRKLQSEFSEPTEQEIQEILESIGKHSKEDELNCGSCGYSTCREKAWAVFNNLAERQMCLPYMREKAESMSFEIIKSSPNGIIAVDNDMNIVEVNATAVKMLGIEKDNVAGKQLRDYMNPLEFINAKNSGKNIKGIKIYFPKTETYAEMSITYVKKSSIVFAILKDITESENYTNILNKVKKDTVETANAVVEKQMRVVQEIASLLGETTAETKIALTKLKNTLISDIDSK